MSRSVMPASGATGSVVVVAIGPFPLSPSGSGAGTDQSTGARTGLRSLVQHYLSGDDRVHVALGPLQEAPAAGGQVVGQAGDVQAEPGQVDEIEIGLVPGPHNAPVDQPVQAGGVEGHLPDHVPDRQARAPGAV